MCKPRVPSLPLHKSGLLICASNPITQEDEKGGSEVQSIGWGDGSVEKGLVVHAWGSKFTSPESKYSWEPEHTSLIKVLMRQEVRCRQENPWMFTNRSACIHSIEYQQKGVCLKQGGRKESAPRLSCDLYLHAGTVKGPHSDKVHVHNHIQEIQSHFWLKREFRMDKWMNDFIN